MGPAAQAFVGVFQTDQPDIGVLKARISAIMVGMRQVRLNNGASVLLDVSWEPRPGEILVLDGVVRRVVGLEEKKEKSGEAQAKDE